MPPEQLNILVRSSPWNWKELSKEEDRTGVVANWRTRPGIVVTGSHPMRHRLGTVAIYFKLQNLFFKHDFFWKHEQILANFNNFQKHKIIENPRTLFDKQIFFWKFEHLSEKRTNFTTPNMFWNLWTLLDLWTNFETRSIWNFKQILKPWFLDFPKKCWKIRTFFKLWTKFETRNVF